MVFYFLLCWCIFTVSASVLKYSDLYRLDIVHYNDFHDRFEETSVNFPVCRSNDSSCIGGFSRLYRGIQVLLQEKPNALVLDAGDTFQGTYWYTLMKWNITQMFINMIPNDVHTLGNHEFDDGVAGLAPYVRALTAPVVAANLITTKDSKLHGLYKPHVILEKNGKRIGIIGLLTTRTLTTEADGVSFLEPLPVVQKEARLLTDMGVDIIVVLSHCGLEVDKEIARQVGENIDVIVGGHTHNLLWNGEAPSKERVSGPYPVLVESENKPGHKVVILTASAYSKYLGNMSVYFDENGDLHYFEGTPVFLNRSIPEDPEINALLKPYAEKLHNLVDEVVGFSTENLELDGCASRECALGDLLADALLNVAKSRQPSDLPGLSFLLRNMIRASLPKGDITRGALINTVPSNNEVVTFSAPGRYIIEAFEDTVKRPWVIRPYAGPYTPMISGIKLKVNTTSHQVLEALLTSDGKVTNLDLDQEYQVTSYDFLLGTLFPNLKKHGHNFKLIGNEVDIFEEYLGKVSPITPYLDNRLTLVS